MKRGRVKGGKVGGYREERGRFWVGKGGVLLWGEGKGGVKTGKRGRVMGWKEGGIWVRNRKVMVAKAGGLWVGKGES